MYNVYTSVYSVYPGMYSSSECALPALVRFVLCRGVSVLPALTAPSRSTSSAYSPFDRPSPPPLPAKVDWIISLTPQETI